MHRKNLLFELWSKNLQTNQNVRFFKLQYLTKELRYELQFLFVARHSQKQQVYLVILNGCGQTFLGMPKVVPVSPLDHINEQIQKFIFKWLGILKSCEFIQSFQVGAVSNAQIDWKLGSSCISKMYLGMNLIFACGQAYIYT